MASINNPLSYRKTSDEIAQWAFDKMTLHLGLCSCPEFNEAAYRTQTSALPHALVPSIVGVVNGSLTVETAYKNAGVIININC